MRPFLLLSLSFIVPALAMAGPQTDGPKVGEAAPAFALTDHEGKKHTLKDYAGKVVVLEWTNPQCPFVVRHYKADTMEALSKQYKGKEVVWLAVNSSHFATAADNKAWVEKEGLDYAVLDDAKGGTGHAYGARTTPDMYVIGPDGKLVYRGAIDDNPYGDKEKVKNYVDGALMAHFAGTKIDPSQTDPYGCTVKYATK